MSDLRDLYQEVVVDHSRRPRNHRPIEGADLTAEGHNPLCGDEVTLFVRFDGDRLEDVSFTGSGCAISTASASLMTETLRGRTREEADRIFEEFREMVTSDPTEEPRGESLGKLTVLAGVREYASRVKCATLVWHTLHKALQDPAAGPASTE